MANKAVFLDRDGTLNIEKNYLFRIEDFEFIPSAIDAIKAFHECGYKVIIITNQAGIAKGHFKENDVLNLHNYIDDELHKHETSIDGYYYCPHHKDGIIKEYSFVCECRKPKPGMILRAAKDFDIDLTQSLLIGDNESDILSGKNAHVKSCFLVRSGHPIDEKNTKADYVMDSVLDVAQFIQSNHNKT